MSVVGRSDWYFNNFSENYYYSIFMIKILVIISNDSFFQNCVYFYQDSLLYNLIIFILLFVFNFCDIWLVCFVKYKCFELFILIYFFLGMVWSVFLDFLVMVLKRSLKLICLKIFRQKC